MIFDSISNWNQYLSHPTFTRIFGILNEFDTSQNDGIYHKENDFYFKVVSYETVSSPSIVESHKKEVDIQIMLSGVERIKIYDTAAVKTTTDYSEKTDCQFYKPLNSEIAELTLSQGKMAIFFPQDIHQCQFSLFKPEHIKKLVIKVDEKLFT